MVHLLCPTGLQFAVWMLAYTFRGLQHGAWLATVFITPGAKPKELWWVPQRKLFGSCSNERENPRTRQKLTSPKRENFEKSKSRALVTLIEKITQRRSSNRDGKALYPEKNPFPRRCWGLPHYLFYFSSTWVVSYDFSPLQFYCKQHLTKLQLLFCLCPKALIPWQCAQVQHRQSSFVTLTNVELLCSAWRNNTISIFRGSITIST